MKWILCGCMIWLSACGKNTPYIENPYENRMKDFIHMGVNAMHEERWKSAEYSFARALQMAQLLSDPALEARAWYNDAMAWKAMGDINQAKGALQQALRISHRYALHNSIKRAQVQWVMLQNGKGELPSLEKNMPADIALSLAYVLAKKNKNDGAAEAYQHVLKHSGNTKNDLLLQGRAMLGLADLPNKFKGVQSVPWLDQALKIFRQVGTPRKTAETLVMIASSRRYTLEKRRDAAKRAETIYHILQDKQHEILAKKMLQSRALLRVNNDE